MVNIKKSEIQALLTTYHGDPANANKDNKEKTSGFFRKFSKKMPAFIAKLEAFMKKLSPESDELSSLELFQLLNALLSRCVRTSRNGKPKASEWLAQQLDAKFEQPRMDCFRDCLMLNQLNQTVFDFICAMNDLRTLPNEAELLGWLENNNLMPKLESAISQLEKTNLLSSYLTQQELSRASVVSKGFRGLFQPVLNIKAATQLGQLIVYANLEKAEQMIITNPSLLTIPVTITDYSHRQVFGTALQLALGAKDVRFHENEIAMVEMITHYLLSKFPDGEFIMAHQINEQFPAGWEAEHEARIKRDQAALDAFVAAIAGSEDPMDWEAAAVIYRDHFDNENKGRGVIKTGFHNNEQAVVAWFKAYNDNYVAFGNRWDSPKNRFLWEKGSACERHLTAADAMALARSIWKIVQEGKHLERCLDFLYGGGSFYPLDAGMALLGYNYGAPRAARAGRFAPGRFLETMSDKKQQRCSALCESAAQTLKQDNSIPRSSTPRNQPQYP